MGLSAKDIMERDYWQAADKLKDDTESMMQDTNPATFT